VGIVFTKDVCILQISGNDFHIYLPSVMLNRRCCINEISLQRLDSKWWRWKWQSNEEFRWVIPKFCLPITLILLNHGRNRSFSSYRQWNTAKICVDCHGLQEHNLLARSIYLWCYLDDGHAWCFRIDLTIHGFAWIVEQHWNNFVNYSSCDSLLYRILVSVLIHLQKIKMGLLSKKNNKK